MLLRTAAVGLLATGVALSATDRQTHTFALPAERSLAVTLTIGTVRVQGESRTDAVVDIVRTAPTAEALARIPVRIDQTAERVVISAEQLDHGTDAGLRADITLRVPHRARVQPVRVIEGEVELTALGGEVDVDIRRGPIEARQLAGTVRLETGIGDITARETRLSSSGLLRFRTFNGNVRLALVERPSDARVMALALNGSIQSDIPLETRDTWGPRWGEATLGQGEPVISIDVVSGMIEIRVK